MLVEVNIKLYDIEKCGYYKKRKKTPEFGSLDETMNQIMEWISGKPLKNTSTYDPPEDSSVLKTYIVNVLKSETNDYFLTIWNQVPVGDKNAVAAIDGGSTFQKLAMKFTNFGKNYIPGFATYFWVSPTNNLVATIRFNRSYNGHQNFRYLIQGFLQDNPSYAKIKKNIGDGTIEIIGYGNDNQEITFPKFITYSRKKVGAIKYIKENIANAKAILGRSRVVATDSKSKSIYNSFLKLYGIKKEKDLSDDEITLEYKVPCDLDSNDFAEIYSEWSRNDSELNDVGFIIHSEPYWLSHEIQKTSMLLDIGTINQELFDLQQIMKAVEKNKAEIIASCSKV